MRVIKFGLMLLTCFLLVACKSSEDRAQEAFERGLSLLEQGDAERARVEFRNAVEELSTHIPARVELARLNRDAGNTRQAFRDYRRIVEQEPDNLEARLFVAQTAFKVREWDLFEEHTAAAIELAPDEPQVQVLDLARKYRAAVVEENDALREDLVAQAESLDNASPDDEILRQILIDGYLGSQRFGKALDRIEAAISDSPNVRDLYMLKMDVLAQLQDEAGIEAVLRRMVENFPEDEEARAGLLQFLLSRDRQDDAETFLRAEADSMPEAKSDEVMALVAFLLRMKGPEAALEELDRRVDGAPGSLRLRALRASVIFDMGDRTTAIAEMQKLVDESTPETDLATQQDMQVTLARMLLSNGNEVGARRLVEEVLEADGSVVGALKMQARWLIDEDDTDRAIAAMRTALAENPQDAESMRLMAEAYQRAGNMELMRDFLSLAVEASGNAPEYALLHARALLKEGRSEQAEDVLIASLRNHPSTPEVLALLGNIYLQTEDLPRLRQVIDALKSSDTSQARSITTELELQLLAREADPGQLISELEERAAGDAENTRLQVSLAQAKLQSGDIEGALEYLEGLIAEDPDNRLYLYLKGVTLAANGDHAAAGEIFEDILHDFPDAVAVWVQMARLAAITDNDQAANAVLDRALEANPESSDLLWAKASQLEAKGQVDQAIDIYEKLYERDSGSEVIANNLASMLATYREDDASLERARQIARRLRDTDIPALQDTYGWILHRSGESGDAVDYLEKAAAGLPQDAVVQYHLGVVYNALGRTEDALKQMRLALQKLGPLGSLDLAESIRQQAELLEAKVAAK